MLVTTRKKIAFIGDILLDIYAYGKVNRISPEFPVPLLKSNNIQEFCPGGVANTANQLKHFNAECHLYGFVDSEAVKYIPNSDRCAFIKGKIPRKWRFYDEDFPLLRWDVESDSYYEEDLEEYRNLLYGKFIQETYDMVVISDYKKGVFDENLAKKIISYCNEKNIKTIVDSKNPLKFWKNCWLFKPNHAEAELFTGEKDVERQIKILKKELKCKNVLITQSGNGVTGIENKNPFSYQPALKTEVLSTIGAGDAFSAILAFNLANNKSLPESVHYAFEAGAEYVRAKHNKPITPYALNKRFNSIDAKIVSLEELLYLKDVLNKPLVFTNGVFDLGLTAGHVQYLQESKKHGLLIVALNSDKSVQRLKGDNRPIWPLEERMKVVAALESVDFVISFDEDTPIKLIEAIKPNLITKGGDYKAKNVAGYGLCPIKILKTYKGMTTTQKIETAKF